MPTAPSQPSTRTRWTQEKALGALHTFEQQYGRYPTYQELDSASKEHSVPNRKSLARLFGSYHRAIAAAQQTR